MSHPRDRYLTVYGRKPVLEALTDPSLEVDKLLIARQSKGESVDALLAAAAARGLRPQWVSPSAVSRLSRNARQDQGVAADVVAARMGALSEALERGLPPRFAALLLDGLTTPANVGMILRTAAAAGLDAVVLPRVGSPEVGPLVIKASAGVAFRAPILRVETAAAGAAALRAAGVQLFGLRGEGALDLFTAPLPERACYVLGNETHGISPAVAAHVEGWLRIPMAAKVESLNVSAAAAVLAFELRRRAG